MLSKKNKIIHILCIVISILLMATSVFIQFTTELSLDVPASEFMETYHLLLFSKFIFYVATLILCISNLYICWIKNKKT